MKKFIPLLALLVSTTLVAQEPEYEIFNTSINSKYAELGVTYIQDNFILFASSKKTQTDKPFVKNRRKNNSNLKLELYTAQIQENGDLVQLDMFDDDINNMFFESEITFSPDLKTAIFTWNNYYDIQSRKDLDGNNSLKMVKGKVTDNLEIVDLEELPVNSPDYDVRSPHLCADGKRLFFASNMPGGFGGFDIYMCDVYEDGSLGTPMNVGNQVNTKNDELYPFIAMCDVLYFSSDGHDGQGKLDVFKATYNGEQFENVENLPAPINSDKNDFYFVRSSINNSGYVTSDRKGGKGNVDIYHFKEKEACHQHVEGLLTDAATQEPLEDVTIEIFEDEISVYKSLFSNHYSVELQCNTTYTIVASKEGYKDTELTVTTPAVESEEFYHTNIALQSDTCILVISGVVVDKQSLQPITNATTQVITASNEKITLELDENGRFTYETDCNNSLKVAASSSNYDSDSIEISSNEKRETASTRLEVAVTLQLVSNEFVSVREQTMIKTDPIYFDLNSSYLNEKAKKELDKVVSTLKKYPTIHIECGSHTDSRESHKYNQWLSERRAKRTADYLISNGIAAERITYKGYGETQLVNKCANGVWCSEADHQLNRRTEFVLTNEKQ